MPALPLRAGLLWALPLALTTSATLGCGSPSAEHSERATKLLLDDLSEDQGGRAVVATVNGTPIYDSCVKLQAEAGALTREQALAECVDFELLAQAANAASSDNGPYLTSSSVQEKGKQELVRAFIAAEYPIQGAKDIPDALVRQLWERVKIPRYIRPELRKFVWCRVPLDEGTSPESPRYRAAERFLGKVYGELKGKRKLVPDDLWLACFGSLDASEGEQRYLQEGVHDLKLQVGKGHRPRTSFLRAFREPFFDGEEVAGMVIAPFVTKYGWDLALIVSISPELTGTYEEVAPELRLALFQEPVYEPDRQALFEAWTLPMQKKTRIETFYENLPAPEPDLSVRAPDKPAAAEAAP